MPRHVCPVWLGYLLANPLRRFIHEPKLILAGLVTPGMIVLDVGPGMGFFTLPMARMVGEKGKVLALEAQEGMLKALRKRAGRSKVGRRIVSRLCLASSLGLEEFEGKIDFALAFAVIHEMPNISRFFREVAAALKPEGRLMIAEPRGHTSSKGFEHILEEAEKAGLLQEERPKICGCYAAVVQKAGGVK